MDIVTGLSAVAQALGLVKELRQIDRSVNDASFKLALADIQSNLADAKIALSDAKLRIAELEAELTSQSLGTVCPICLSGRLKVQSVKPHDWANVEFHTVVCANSDCSYSTTRLYDPTRGIYTGKSE